MTPDEEKYYRDLSQRKHDAVHNGLRLCFQEIDRLRALCKRASVWIDQDPRWQEAEPLRSTQGRWGRMKFDDGIPTRCATDADADSPYVAALRPMAALAFAPTCKFKTMQCGVCGCDMLAYARRKVCIDCYPAWSKKQQNEMRIKRRARKRAEAER